MTFKVIVVLVGHVIGHQVANCPQRNLAWDISRLSGEDGCTLRYLCDYV